jgi:hypothetical protein
MLQSISWSEFFSFVGLSLAIYYPVTGLLLYGEEIKAKLIRPRPSVIEALDDKTHSESIEPNALMGAIVNESPLELDGESVQSSEIEFRENSDPADEIKPAGITVEQSLESTLTGILTEIKALAEVIPHNSKPELEEMFKTLLERYPQLISYRAVLSRFIIDTCQNYSAIPISLAEVWAWWPVKSN